MPDLYSTDGILHSAELELVIIPNADTLKSYTIPEIQNYNESKFLKFNINETAKQLKICSFRTKRHLALKSSLTQLINDLYNFKFPVFSSIFFICTCLMTLSLGILSTLSVWLIFLILIQHPQIKPKVDGLLNHVFFDRRMLNK